MIIIINYSFAIKNNDTIKRFVQLFCISTGVYEQGAPKKLLSQRCMHIIFFPETVLPIIVPVRLYAIMMMYKNANPHFPNHPTFTDLPVAQLELHSEQAFTQTTR